MVRHCVRWKWRAARRTFSSQNGIIPVLSLHQTLLFAGYLNLIYLSTDADVIMQCIEDPRSPRHTLTYMSNLDFTYKDQRWRRRLTVYRPLPSQLVPRKYVHWALARVLNAMVLNNDYHEKTFFLFWTGPSGVRVKVVNLYIGLMPPRMSVESNTG